MSVLSAGTGANIENLDDIEMKKKGAYSKIKSGYTNCACNDLMMEVFKLLILLYLCACIHISLGIDQAKPRSQYPIKDTQIITNDS